MGEADAVVYDILKGSTKLKGEIGEVIAAHYLRSLGFIVDRPGKILHVLEKSGVPNNYEVQYLRR